jgi:aspartate aminotransferase
VLQIGRSLYSMPPDHGAAIATQVLTDRALRALWITELEAMRRRIRDVRKLLAERLRLVMDDGSFDFLESQNGMFSMLGVPRAAVDRLRERHHIYLLGDSRMNVAGLMPDAAGRVAEAIAEVLRAAA